MNINRAISLQCASDDIGTIAETAKELYQLLDRFFETHDSEITSRLELAWPKHSEINPSVAKALCRLADQLAPPEA